MSEWKLIETAPKDEGEEVLLFEGDDFIYIGSYKSDLLFYSTTPPEYKWFSDSGRPIEPTHWMPLPEPPKTKCVHDDWEIEHWKSSSNGSEGLFVFLVPYEKIKYYQFCPHCGEKADGRKNS